VLPNDVDYSILTYVPDVTYVLCKFSDGTLIVGKPQCIYVNAVFNYTNLWRHWILTSNTPLSDRCTLIVIADSVEENTLW
jgi:hypothetical protein